MDATDIPEVTSSHPAWRLSWKAAIPPVAAWPIVATVMAGVFFLTGRVYRLGYLGYFHLEPSLFPDDLSARVTYAVAAWTQALALFSHATSGFWVGHMVLGILAPTLTLLAIAVLLALLRTLGQLARHHGSRASAPPSLRRVGRAVGRGLLGVVQWLFPSERAWKPVDRARRAILAVLTTYVAILILGLVIALSLIPFELAGEHIAAINEAAQFHDRAMVKLHEGGQERSYRLMECGPAYCALYAEHHAVVVPLSDLKRADSPPVKD
jgi:hypothetical protein